MLKVICITSGTLKIALSYNLQVAALPNYIAIGSRCDYGFFYFDIFMVFIYTLHCISFDCGFRIKHVQHFSPKN